MYKTTNEPKVTHFVTTKPQYQDKVVNCVVWQNLLNTKGRQLFEN